MSNADLPSRPDKDPEFQNVVVQLTAAERFVAVSSLIVIVILLVGDIFLDDYSVSHSSWLIAVATLGAIYFFYAGDRNPWHEWYPWIAEMGGWGLALTGVIEFLDNIFDDVPNSGSSLFFLIAFLVAGGFAGVGAFQIRTGR